MSTVPIALVDELRRDRGVLALGLTPQLLADAQLGLDSIDGQPAALADAPDTRAALARYLRDRARSARLAEPGAVERLALAAADGPGLVLMAGLGDGSPSSLRRAGAAIARAALADATEELSIAVPRLSADATAALVEGLLLGGYEFRVGGAAAPMIRATLTGGDPIGRARGQAFGAATVWVRDLINTRSSVKTPVWLAAQARAELEPRGVQIRERDVEWLAENRFGGVLAVGAGSVSPPRLIEASWHPRDARPGRHVVLVGKSITYDSGGLNVKPLESMNSMYTDMAGGAAVLGALRLVAELNLPIKVTGLLPAAENAVSGSAMRQNDVIRHYGGRTSEIVNTDAEGRLVLADAMAYAAARLEPTTLIDLATLTGAMKVALGGRTGGVFATSDQLAAELIAAGARVDEPLWRLPLADEYLPALNSDIADLNNSPGNPGAITAALYLRPFSAGLPWAHLDIAGPARSSDDDGELTRGATGFGARLLAQWLVGQAS